MLRIFFFYLTSVSVGYAQDIVKECFDKNGVQSTEAGSEYCVFGKKVFRVAKMGDRIDSVETYIDTVRAFYTETKKFKFIKLYNKHGYQDGNFTEAYPNGRAKERGLYKDGRKTGFVVNYYPSGKKRSTLQYFPANERVTEWYETDFKIIDYWDSTGNQTVSKGKGMCHCDLASGRNEVGKVVDGLRDSIWSEYEKDTLVLMESYSRGKMKEGVRYYNGKSFKYTKFETPAEYLGGLDGFTKILSKNLTYPQQARRMGIEGTVLISFVINKDGSPGDFKVIKGIHSDCDFEAIRVVRLLKEWYPARRRGRAVSFTVLAPVQFNLE